MAIQANATTKTHTHDGTGRNGPKLSQINTHENPDTDASATALHHTLGTGAYQAARGNHTHSQYVDLSNPQTIAAKKTFLGGNNAPEIPDFRNSIHHHGGLGGGGLVAPMISTFNVGVVVLEAGTAQKINISPSFEIPSGMKLAGEATISIRVVNNITDGFCRVVGAVSFGADGVTFSAAENISVLGDTDNDVNGNTRMVVVGGATSSTNSPAWRYRDIMVIPYETSTLTGRRFLKLYLSNKTGGPGWISITIANKYWITPTVLNDPNTWNGNGNPGSAYGGFTS
jgi:hypothetical protein